MMISFLKLTRTLCFSKVNIHSLSHNYPIEMRLEWRLENISACFPWIDKKICGIWALCLDAIVDELGSFTLIGFSHVSLMWTTVFRAYR